MKLPVKLPQLMRSDGRLRTITTSSCSLRNYRRTFNNQAIPLIAHFANKQTQVLLYLMYNADSNNAIFCTYADIMANCDIKDRTLVAKVLKELIEAEAIVKLTTSQYMLNPAISMQGSNQKFGLLASEFNSYVVENKKRKDKRNE